MNKLALSLAGFGVLGNLLPFKETASPANAGETSSKYTTKKFKTVFGLDMAYVEVGEGSPIVFLHGNGSHSYLWRNIIPYAEPYGRCIAPDLIGMGASEKLPDSGPGSYRYVEHRKYLDKLLEELGVIENVVFVVHDWGGVLGFDWAYRHQKSIKGLAYMEVGVRLPPPGPKSDGLRRFKGIWQKPETQRRILEENFFVEQMVIKSLGDNLTEEDIAAYRRPYLEPGESRRPTLAWPLEITLDGEPSDVWEIKEGYFAWLATSEVPKLFVIADPGAALTGENRDFARTFKNQMEVKVAGSHFLQEVSPDAIGQALADWLGTLD
jgi:haloalkane dehalogenase